MPRHTLLLANQYLTLDQLHSVCAGNASVALDACHKDRVGRARGVIEDIIISDRLVYGVNTGFGKLADIPVASHQVSELQRRLVLSHAAGVGPPMPLDVVRGMMALKIHALAQGFSGCRWEVIELLTTMLNRSVIPVIPVKGSVGASGDLAPLAHMALAMLGEGTTWHRSRSGWKTLPAREALDRAGLQPLCLEAKEGLAILNGTQAMTAYLAWALMRARTLLTTADILSAISLEALLGTLTAFDARIQHLRRHPGQHTVAANIRRLLAASPIVASHRHSNHKIQDAYSLRCIPQVHGAVRDAIAHVTDTAEREMNAVTDNPLVFPDEHEVLSGGNFHGEPIAMAADYFAIALAELASLAERRIAHLLDATVSNLPAFLSTDEGLNSGFMMAQVTAAALVSENKVLTHPASVDSIPTSANKEDHVSMGMHAARKAVEVLANLEHVLAIELLCGTQALDLRAPLRPAAATAAVRDLVRQTIPFWHEDRLMHRDIEAATLLIQSGAIMRAAEAVCDTLA